MAESLGDRVSGALGDTVTGIGVALGNAAEAIKATGDAIPAFTFIAGLVLLLLALMQCAKVATGQTQGASYWGALVTAVVAVALMNYQNMLDGLWLTVMGTSDNPQVTGQSYKVGGESVDATGQKALVGYLLLVKLIGFFAVLRGLWMFHAVANHKTQQASYASGAVHIAGGIMASNILITLEMIYETFGVNLLEW